MKTRPDLSGVPETMLWPLWNRACESLRPDGLIRDPVAVSLVERIDYPFRQRFGRPSVLHAVRARFFDDVVLAHLREHPEAAVVALGEGLETQRLRLGQSAPRAWLSVDLPEARSIRDRLIELAPGEQRVAASALSQSWWDAVPPHAPPLFIAAGLLMYFTASDVTQLLAGLATRFPRARVAFDCIPRLLSNRTLRGWRVTSSYRAPPMPWGEDEDQLPAYLNSVNGLRLETCLSFFHAYPKRTPLMALIGRAQRVRFRYSPTLVVARFEP